jgi:hypothetical protein
METAMNQHAWLFVVVLASMGAGVGYAQYPIMDRVADKVIEKYQSSTCEELWEKRGKKKPSEETQRVMGFLRSDPDMRKAFFDRIAGPVMNKMFECGMIP